MRVVCTRCIRDEYGDARAHSTIYNDASQPPGVAVAGVAKRPIDARQPEDALGRHPNGVDFEEAVEQLALVFADNANDSEFDLEDDHPLTARRELRLWLKRGLIVERNGQVLATDALQRSLQFLDWIEDNTMTSTASRLATVQRAIEDLEAQLNRSQVDREKSLMAKIDALTKELAAVQSGEFDVLEGPQAVEGIREVYQLAISLQADFRRVEDSYREADRSLRQRIISERQNRGQVVDGLLSSHDALINTNEGQVFESFYAQLVKTTEIEEMKRRLRSILVNDNTNRVLEQRQKADLRQLVSRLLRESERVIQAREERARRARFSQVRTCRRAPSGRRVLHDIFQAALEVDWQSQKVRRGPSRFRRSPYPPPACPCRNDCLSSRSIKPVTANSI